MAHAGIQWVTSPVEQHWPLWQSLAGPGGAETLGVFGDLSLFGGEPFGCTFNLSFAQQRLAAWHVLQMNQSSVLGFSHLFTLNLQERGQT